ncbi:FHA domain-containing protein [Natronosporangium hydrolyticum]|uniref:FHA domain-containing protein n=1 Tax=Natronosporangium hydrolyticum TaxID=2811111 RepID=A0A895YNX4_9ACTN|nr:FHA domain-containing protein [Natronosporangium hydrolyticum]QSB16983.1 FHA domain-containing protein [Natronosporangium hydrolyticum]
MAHVLELTLNGEPTRALLQTDQVLRIGRDPSCQLVVSDRSVSRQHAEIARTDGGWVIRDLGSRNGIHHAGERSETIRLTDGIEIRIGSAHDGPLLRIGLPAPAAVTTQPVQPAADAPPTVTLSPAEPAQPAPQPAAPPAAAPPPQPAAPPPPPAPSPAAGRPELAAFDASGVTSIGRSSENDVVLRDLLVSRRHAEVRQLPAGYQLTDLGSTNGTYHNGRRIDRVMLEPGDLVSIGHFQLAFDGERLHEHLDAGPVSLSSEQVTVAIGKHRIVNDVSFALEQGSLLGIIGPSGCGKSTLIRALTGLQQASAGRVRYDNRDLYADYAELRYRIGMVPQDDVLHRQLTVRRALRFAARLRFADDVPRRERSARVEEVMDMLGIAGSARQRIDRLSGGQRKRTSVALELLTEPSMLCLDEPTSGLDPALDREVMQQLRGMADRGRTILCVTHSVLHLSVCDRILVMCPGGTTGYFGPPSEVLSFFEADDYADVFAKVTREPEYWTRRYRESDLYRRYIAEPITAHMLQPSPGRSQQPGPAPAPETAPAGIDPPTHLAVSASGTNNTSDESKPAPAATRIAQALSNARPSMLNRAKDPVAPLRQFTTLSARMFAVITADRGYALFLLGLPMVLALLSHTVPGDTGLGPAEGATGDDRLEAMRILVVLVVGASFIGISSAIREIVNESTIYQRERAVGLSPGAYLAAKFAVLGLINVCQVTIFVYLSLLGRGAPAEALVMGSPMVEIITPIAMVTTSCTMLGLCISALARSVAQTTPVLVVVVMAMLVLSGGLFELHGQAVLNQISWTSPTRWGFAAGGSTVDLLSMVRPIFTDPLWTHSTGSWWRSILLLVVQIALLGAAARLAMRRLEPGRR